MKLFNFFSLAVVFLAFFGCKSGANENALSESHQPGSSISSKSNTDTNIANSTSNTSKSSTTTAVTHNPCMPQFPYKDGWLGGDAVFSLALGGSNQKTLWMFGDTFINTNNPEKRGGPGATIVANTIAISECQEDQFKLEYFWQSSSALGSSQHQAFFPGDGRETWPGSAVIINEKLHIFAMIVHKDSKLPGGFAVEGTRLITIDNYQDRPQAWKTRIKDFGTGLEILAGISNIITEHHLLLYSSLHTQKGQPMALLRCPLNDIESCRPELLTNSGWRTHEGNLKDAKILLQGAGTEFSVAKIDKRYVATFNSIRDFFPAADVTIAFAKHPEESFGEPQIVEKFPGNPDFGGTKQAYCYAAKEHPHLRQGSTAIITYVCNSFDFLGETVSNLKLYQVRVIETDLSLYR